MSTSKNVIEYFLSRLEAHKASVLRISSKLSETEETENRNMLIKSTDGIGPDIETSDVPNPGLVAEKNDGKAVDQSSFVDTSKINLPTPMGALAALSVNGPVQDGSDMAEQKPEGDSSPIEKEPVEPSTEHQELRAEDVPSAEPLPVDEYATPKANTTVTSTFDPIELKADSPVYSPLQPEPEALSLPVMDIEVSSDIEEAADIEAPSDIELPAKVEPTESETEEEPETDPEAYSPDDLEELTKP